MHSRPFCDVCHPLRYWPSSAYFPLQWTLQYQPVDVVTSDVSKVGNFSLFFFSLLLELDSCSSANFRTPSFLFFSLQDIFTNFRYAHISNDCNFAIFLVVIFLVSHPYNYMRTRFVGCAILGRFEYSDVTM